LIEDDLLFSVVAFSAIKIIGRVKADGGSNHLHAVSKLRLELESIFSL
jgi:hypothetical protein